jgi:integrase
MNLYKQQITTYTLPDGSYRTPDGKRVTSETPGAVAHKSESAKWYGTIGNKKVPLHESLEAARKLFKMKSGQHAIDKELPEEARQKKLMKDQLDRSLAEHLQDYRRCLEAENAGATHVERSIARIEALLDGCGFKTWEDLDGDKVLEYLAGQRDESPRFGVATTNHYIAAAKSFSRWLAGGRRKGNSKPRVPSDKLFSLRKLQDDGERRVDRRSLTAKQFEELLRVTRTSETTVRGLTCADRHALYVVAAYTGFRVSELASLTPASFKVAIGETPVVRLKGTSAKNKKPHDQELHPDVAKLLRGYLDGRERTAAVWPGKADAPHESWHKHAADMLRRDLEAAGIAYLDDDGQVFDFHALRGQYITNLARAGVSLQMAQKLARHSTPTLTANVYTKLQLDDRVGAVAKLPGLDSRKIAAAKIAVG